MKTHPYLTRQQMQNDQYEIFHYNDTQIRNVTLHHHDFYECYFFLSGNVTYIIEGKSYTLHPGDLIMINSRELHQAVIRNTDIAYERIVLWVSLSYLKELSSEKTDLRQCFEDPGKVNVLRSDSEHQQIIRLLLNRLLSLESYHGLGSELLAEAYLKEFFVLLNTTLFSQPSQPAIDVEKNSLTEQIIEYISLHIEEDIQVDLLSQLFFISKYHLIREFKKHSGTTIHKYIVQKKLIRAKELILKGTAINQVYLQCGFGDYSNFFRAFKKEYGITPKEFYRLFE